jgi:hypothetical protein
VLNKIKSNARRAVRRIFQSSSKRINENFPQYQYSLSQIKEITTAIKVLESVPLEVLDGMGFHFMRKHFHNPIPDLVELRSIPADWWEVCSELPGINMNEDDQLRLLTEVFPAYRSEYDLLPLEPTDNPYGFYLNNQSFSGTDALVLFCMLRHLKPRRVVEVGAGLSTYLCAQVARDYRSMELISVDPYPNDVLKQGFPGLSKLIDQKVQEVSLDIFLALDEGDILFIDSSHTVKTGGDVNYLFLEVLPRLQKNVYIHVHDIFFPREYPRSWVLESHLFWSEMYLLQAFLAFNNAFDVVFANSHMVQRYPALFMEVFPKSPWHGGGSFWMRKNR